MVKRKIIIPLISVLLALLLIITPLGIYSSKKLVNNYSFLFEKKYTIQVAAIGNSDLYSGFIPSRLYDKTGYTSSIVAYPSQTTRKSYRLLKKYLKNQTPNVLIFETDMLYQNADKLTPTQRIKNAYNDLRSIDIKGEIERIKQQREMFKSADKKSFTHGYVFNTTRAVTTPLNNMRHSDGVESIPPENLKYADKILKLCKGKNITVVFVELPSYSSWTSERHNAVQSYADKNGITFIDMNTLVNEINLDLNGDFRDNGNHLNYYGAIKTTDYLSQIILTYGLKDTRSDHNYDDYAGSIEEFKKLYC